jgi:hypothetical protein
VVPSTESVASETFTRGRLWATAAVRSAEVDGLRVILDLNSQSYLVLDEAATAFWSVLIGGGDDSVRRLSEKFEVERPEILATLEAFRGRCVAEGLLQEGREDSLAKPSVQSEISRRRGRAGWGALRALGCLLKTQRSLQEHGFAYTYQRYATYPPRGTAAPLELALHGFRRAESLFIPRRAPSDCLARSLSLFRFMRSMGVAVDHVIGVRRLPFAAHAWVEFDGLPLLDVFVHGFTPLARIGVNS